MRRAARLLVAAVAVAAAFGAGFLLTHSNGGATAAAPPVGGERPASLLDEVRGELTAAYYRWIEPEVLAQPSVDEIIAALDDPHTDYLTSAEFANLQERTEGTYSGIGLTVAPAANGLQVTSALKGPAYDAGIRTGDVIVRIDGERAAKLTFEQALSRVKGESGTVVFLRVKRPGEGRLEFTVVREDVSVPPISARMIKAKKTPVGYVRVFSFAAGASGRIERATTRLVSEGAQGVIIDLRDNPGGLLTEAVSAASVYLDEGLVCRTSGVHEEERTFEVTGDATHAELPVVVLVNTGSASAAEIVAAALGDNDRAVLVGERTYGKASVQSIAPLQSGGALKLTTAKYVTPAGADITGRGIEPPILAVDDPLTQRDEALRIARRTLVELLAQ